MKEHVKGLTVWVLVNLFVFIGHYFVSDTSSLIVNIPLSYGVNLIASLLICIAIFSLKELFKSQIGFIFLGLSFLKMILLYFILCPKDTSNGVETLDALVIFIPFFVNLIMEQFFLIKVLKIGETISVLRKD